MYVNNLCGQTTSKKNILYCVDHLGPKAEFEISRGSAINCRHISFAGEKGDGGRGWWWCEYYGSLGVWCDGPRPMSVFSDTKTICCLEEVVSVFITVFNSMEIEPKNKRSYPSPGDVTLVTRDTTARTRLSPTTTFAWHTSEFKREKNHPSQIFESKKVFEENWGKCSWMIWERRN